MILSKLNFVLSDLICSKFPPAPNQHLSFGTCLGEQVNTALSWLLLPFPTSTPKPRAEGSSPSAPARTGENTGFSPVFFLHVLHGYGVHSGSDTGFSHLVLPVLNRPHPLQHPKRTRLRLFSPEIGCVSLFLSSFDLQNFQLCFCASCRIVVTG